MGFTLEGYKYITINHFDQNLGKTLNLSSEIERFCLRWLNIIGIDAAFSIPITPFSNHLKNKTRLRLKMIMMGQRIAQRNSPISEVRQIIGVLL